MLCIFVVVPCQMPSMPMADFPPALCKHVRHDGGPPTALVVSISNYNCCSGRFLPHLNNWSPVPSRHRPPKSCPVVFGFFPVQLLNPLNVPFVVLLRYKVITSSVASNMLILLYLCSGETFDFVGGCVVSWHLCPLLCTYLVDDCPSLHDGHGMFPFPRSGGKHRLCRAKSRYFVGRVSKFFQELSTR